MSPALQLRHEEGRHLELATGDGGVLWRYVYVPDTPANEAPRPYLHPLYAISGDLLTNFRPHDHPWHHGLSLTLTSVGGVNFWGGPSHRAADGYRWRDDHGTQVHRGWLALEPDAVAESLDWVEPRGNRLLLQERRELRTELRPGGWSLRWASELRNASGEELTLGNYHALGGLAGSHYTGLQFRGARGLLDEHGDPAIGVEAEGGLQGESAVHGALARWMEWSCQHDGSLRRTVIRFEHPAGPLPWFLRAKEPLAAFAFHREHLQVLAAGATLRLEHVISFSDQGPEDGLSAAGLAEAEGRTPEARGQRPEAGGRRAACRAVARRAKAGGRGPEAGSQRTEAGGRTAVDGGRRTEVGGRRRREGLKI